MRIYFVSPTHYDSNGGLHKTTRYWTSGITLPYLKAITPKGHDVQLVDELMHDVDLEHECDVVGITAMTHQAIRAYEVADRFRERQVPVVLGGIHPTVLPEEALRHATDPEAIDTRALVQRAFARHLMSVPPFRPREAERLARASVEPAPDGVFDPRTPGELADGWALVAAACGQQGNREGRRAAVERGLACGARDNRELRRAQEGLR